MVMGVNRARAQQIEAKVMSRLRMALSDHPAASWIWTGCDAGG